MTRYRKLPVEIEAVEFRGFRNEAPLFVASPWPSWLTEAWALGHPDSWRDTPVPGALVECSGQLLAVTLEGPLVVSPGDFIIRGVEGELYPCKPAIFAATYEVADETPIELEWRDLESAPRDGTMVWLLLDYGAYGECALADARRAATLGFNNNDHQPDDEWPKDKWQYVGWNWEQDCFCDHETDHHKLVVPAAWRPIGFELDQTPAEERLAA